VKNQLRGGRFLGESSAKGERKDRRLKGSLPENELNGSLIVSFRWRGANARGRLGKEAYDTIHGRTQFDGGWGVDPAGRERGCALKKNPLFFGPRKGDVGVPMRRTWS